MKCSPLPTLTLVLCSAFLPISAANASDATTELFNLLNNGGCQHSALTGKTWTISTFPTGTHGELMAGDNLRFELAKAAKGVKKQSAVKVLRNGVAWTSTSGWSGECVRDGNLSVWVVSGEVEIAGCRHEIAIGRLDHDDHLADKVEIVFQDSLEEFNLDCAHFDQQHPGHAHGTGSGD